MRDTNDVTGPLAIQSLLYGNYEPAIIRGFKYEDYNNNGRRDNFAGRALPGTSYLVSQNFFDLNGDGVYGRLGQDATIEPPMENVRFEILLNGVAQLQPAPTPIVPGDPTMVPWVETDATGKFQFVGIAPGTYTVRETLFQDTNAAADLAMFGGNPLVTLPINDTFTDANNPGQGLVRDQLEVTFTVASQNMINLSTGALRRRWIRRTICRAT